MKENDFLDGVSSIAPDVVERFVSMDNKLQRKASRPRAVWLRFGAVAACFALIIGALVALPMLKEDSGARLPPISAIKSGSKITGRQELFYGNSGTDSQDKASRIGPGFYIRTVVQAKVIEVLADEYYEPGMSECYRVARLSVVEEIRGEGLPDEIYLKFPFYSRDIFDGYDTFIFSLQQIGAENYMMINAALREVTYFPHMFMVEGVSDLGYGSVIAFNDGTVDVSFFEKADHFDVVDDIHKRLSDPSDYRYPVSRSSTTEEAKANIIKLAENTESVYVSRQYYDYVTAEDIFLSEERKQVRDYLAPSESNVFLQEMYAPEGRLTVIYTRTVNGFLTDERIVLNPNGSVERYGEGYSAADLASMPNIGEALEDMSLSELQPPHIEVVDGMNFKCSRAQGCYRKVDGRIYGVVRVMWYYTYPEFTNGYVMDDLYYLYAEDGSGSVVEREALRELLGNDPIIASFRYNEYVGIDK